METESSLQTEKHPKAWLGIIWVVLFFILDTIGQFFAIFPPVIEAIQSGRSVEATLDTIQISWYFNAAEAFAIAVVLFLAYLTGMKFFFTSTIHEKSLVPVYLDQSGNPDSLKRSGSPDQLFESRFYNSESIRS